MLARTGKLSARLYHFHKHTFIRAQAFRLTYCVSWNAHYGRQERDIMLSSEEIAEQQQLLATHRRTLAVYLRQRAQIGQAYSPPALINGIDETREHIRRIKEALKAAGITAPNDPDDEEPQQPQRHSAAQPRQDPVFPGWLVPAIIALVLASGGGYWWYYNQSLGTPGQTETAAPVEGPIGEATPVEESPTERAPAAQTDVDALASQLQEANIALSETQVEVVRGFINDPGTGYKLLAEHVLQIVGSQRFRQTLYLDEIDVRYTEVVGTDHYADFDQDQLKSGMVRAWNEHYTDQRVDTFDEIVEPRT
jgi:hypothetical protein